MERHLLTTGATHAARSDYLARASRHRPAAAVVLLHDGFADARDGVDDGPPPVLDRIALTRGVLDEIAAAGLTGCSLGSALDDAGAERTPWLAELGDPA